VDNTATQAVGTTGQEPEQTTITGQEPEQQTTPDSDNSTLDAEALQAELAKVRREAAKYRVQLREVQTADEQRKRDEMTELEKARADLDKAKAQAAEAQAQAKRQVITNRALVEAQKLNIRADALDIVVGLLDFDALEVSEDGAVSDLVEAIQEIVKAKPFLVQETTAGRISPTNPANGRRAETREQRLNRLFSGGGHKIFDIDGPGGGAVGDQPNIIVGG